MIGHLVRTVISLTGGNDVVDDDHSLPGLDGIALHLKDVLAVFLRESLRRTLARQLALLPNRHESCAQAQGDGGPKQEPSAFQPDDHVHVALGSRRGVERIRDLKLQRPRKTGVQLMRREQGHNVFEQDARRREIRKLPQPVAELYFKTYASSC